jgi:hypothetical protein
VQANTTASYRTPPVQIKLSAVLSLGNEQRELSWHGLMQHLRGRSSAAEADAQLQADVETLGALWAAVRRRLRRRCICYPRMLVTQAGPRRCGWCCGPSHGNLAGWRRCDGSCQRSIRLCSSPRLNETGHERTTAPILDLILLGSFMQGNYSRGIVGPSHCPCSVPPLLESERCAPWVESRYGFPCQPTRPSSQTARKGRRPTGHTLPQHRIAWFA